MGEGELNKRAVENFIKCGAMDCFGYHRSELLAVYDQMMDSVSASRKKNLEAISVPIMPVRSRRCA